MKQIGVRRSLSFHPKPFVEADRVDDEGVAVPVPDRVSVVARNEVLGVWSAVHINDAERLRTILIEDVDGLCFRNIHNFIAAGRNELTWSTRWLTARVGLEQIRLAIFIQSF